MFFSVKTPMKIDGKVYKTCICYTASSNMESTLKSLAQKGKVTLYDELVFFQNGKLIKTKTMLKEEAKEAKKLEKEAKKLEKETAEIKEEDF